MYFSKLALEIVETFTQQEIVVVPDLCGCQYLSFETPSGKKITTVFFLLTLCSG